MSFLCLMKIFCKDAQCLAFIMHEAILLTKFLQTKQQIRSMNKTFYDLYYTVIKIFTKVGEKLDLRQNNPSFLYNVNRDLKMNSPNYQKCIIDVPGASYAKHLRSEKHLENIKHEEMIIPEGLFQESIENKLEKIHKQKPF